ncbi:MAG: hypothetical protein R3E44_03575 [Paracoccaceae bacterium]
MSGTRSPSRTELRTDGRWSPRKLAVVLYPFSTAAVAINLFMLGLMGQTLGLPALSPMLSLALAVPLGVPVNWAVARWVNGLIDEAER